MVNSKMHYFNFASISFVDAILTLHMWLLLWTFFCSFLLNRLCCSRLLLKILQKWLIEFKSGNILGQATVLVFFSPLLVWFSQFALDCFQAGMCFSARLMDTRKCLVSQYFHRYSWCNLKCLLYTLYHYTLTSALHCLDCVFTVISPEGS